MVAWISRNNVPLYGYTAFCLLIHLLMDMWVVLAIVNSTTMNMGVHVFV